MDAKFLSLGIDDGSVGVVLASRIVAEGSLDVLRFGVGENKWLGCVKSARGEFCCKFEMFTVGFIWVVGKRWLMM